MVINQAYLFLIFTLNGVFIGLLFDFFRILRKSFKTSNLITYIEDILFWIITGISIIFSMYKFSNGSLRIFMFLGLGFGIIIYMLTLSKVIIKTCVFVISTIKRELKFFVKIIIMPLKSIYKILDKLVLRPLYLFSVKFHTFLTKKAKNINNKIKNMRNLEKTAKTS